MPTDPELPNFQAFNEFLDLMAGSQPSADLTKIKSWAEKMEAWAKGVVADYESLDDENDDLRGQVASMEEVQIELDDWEENYRELRENLLDVDRGLLDRDDYRELIQELRYEVQCEGDWRKVVSNHDGR